jgi:hypothetical protein
VSYKRNTEPSNDNSSVLSRKDVFDKVAQSVKYGNLGILVGAGLSMAIFNEGAGGQALSWNRLLKKCARFFKINFSTIDRSGLSYPELASLLCKAIAKRKKITAAHSLIELRQKISDFTSLYPDSESRKQYRKVFDDLSPKWVITTNYDTVIESILTGKAQSLSPDDHLLGERDQIPVYHLHGVRTNPDSIVITQEDYVRLFRPNEYRQHKLPLLLSESTTLMVGYGLGDMNVQTAVDWARNVYPNRKGTFPNSLIQLVRKKNSKEKPYTDNGILILEFSDLATCLEEICAHVRNEVAKEKRARRRIKSLENKFSQPSEQTINDFINDGAFRTQVLHHLKDHESSLINGFLELLSRALDSVWLRARQDGGFPYYNKYLKLIFDVVGNTDFISAPPALVQMLCYRLDKVAYYMGPNFGDANAAYDTWLSKGQNLNDEIKRELRNICRGNENYRNLRKFLREI